MGTSLRRKEEGGKMSDIPVIHVKDSALEDKPLCLTDEKDIGWTTRTSARAIATCAECFAEVLRDSCSICNGNGGWKEYGEEVKCPACDIEQAEKFIHARNVGNFWLKKEGRL
jgi:hypothetical protein